jgi:Amt family ammonium transporter
VLAQVGVQLTGIVAVTIWTVSVSFVILKLIDRIIGLRVPEAEETEGLDITQHEEKGYSL